MNVWQIGKQKPLFPQTTRFRRCIIKANIVAKVKTIHIFDLALTQVKIR